MNKFKSIIISLAIVLSGTFKLIADEGMWIPLLLNKNYDEMKKLGLKLTPEDLYSINHSSLKDAIIQFGNGCTGEIVSSEGLILTNHHCGYGQIQQHSSVDHDYLTDGFWAMSKSEELTNPGLTVKFLVRMDDITEKILKDLPANIPEADREQKIEEISKKIADEETKGTGYTAVIKPIFDGNQYFMYVYETYKDIRLVGTPPSSIGKFGGDTDNWMWPRHTGDFCVFRVYMSPDGKPAEYSAENVPFKPKHYLPVSLDGVKKDDFTMVMGYPGRTNRYLCSFGVQQAIDVTNPATVKIRDKKLEIMRNDMLADPAVRIKYASKYARTSNYWKYYIGQTKQLKQLKVYDQKVAIESDFENWVNADVQRKAVYGTVLDDLGSSWEEGKEFNKLLIYLNEAAFGIDVIGFANQFSMLYQTLRKEDTSMTKINKYKAMLAESADAFFKDYNQPTDKKIFAALMQMYYNDLSPEYYPSAFEDVKKNFKGDFNKYADYAYSKSVFVSKEKTLNFLKNPSAKVFEKDPIFDLMFSIIGSYKKYATLNKSVSEKRDKATRLFVEGIMKMNPDKNFYPNANSTMRFTYGTVQDYIPRDGVEYDYFTTIDGIIEKEDDESLEFVVPKRLHELYDIKDYGRYAENGILKVCFTTTNDITGGNSGSPVMNGNGELIGLAFDGNWEAMSGDIAFEPSLQRTIVVDIRYVLFIIDKFAGAKHLVDEMTIAKK